MLSLDHAGVIVRDLAAGAARWEGLGFALSPVSRQRGRMPDRDEDGLWATANRCAIFKRRPNTSGSRATRPIRTGRSRWLPPLSAPPTCLRSGRGSRPSSACQLPKAATACCDSPLRAGAASNCMAPKASRLAMGGGRPRCPVSPASRCVSPAVHRLRSSWRAMAFPCSAAAASGSWPPHTPTVSYSD